MNDTTEVRFWDVRRNRSSRVTSYEVRWVVAGRQRSRTRSTKALAEAFLSELRQAARRGESFDVETGLPESMAPPPPTVSWLEFAQAFVEVKWPGAAAKTRDSLTDALATITAALVDDPDTAPDPRLLRTALRQHLLPPPARDLPRDRQTDQVIDWLQRHSIPVTDLTAATTLRRGLDAITLTLDGTTAAATTINRKRAVFHNALQYAVEIGHLPANNLTTLGWRAPKTSDTVDLRVVVNPSQAEQLLTAVTYIGPVDRGRHQRGFFATLYYAGLRPAEAQALRLDDCHLPETGWGRLTITGSRPEANRRWSDSGQAHELRSLKHRAHGDTRIVPVPPRLVELLREHVAEFGTASDGRLFHTRRGGVLGSTAYADTWAQARTLALTPSQVASPLADRPYALRHAAVSLWLNAGVPPTEIAERAGHSVEVLLRVYAKCLDGNHTISNDRIETTLRQLTRPDRPNLSPEL